MTYDYDQTLAMLQEIVDRIGLDTLYEDIRAIDLSGVREGACFNVHKRNDGTVVPGCIVGRLVVDHLHIDPNDIWEGYASSSSYTLMHWVEGEYGHSFSKDALELLELVQNHQDNGRTWGEALYIAHGKLRPNSL